MAKNWDCGSPKLDPCHDHSPLKQHHLCGSPKNEKQGGATIPPAKKKQQLKERKKGKEIGHLLCFVYAKAMISSLHYFLLTLLWQCMNTCSN